jgi:RNA polymerase sigma-70 factor (ECF subfamily)
MRATIAAMSDDLMLFERWRGGDHGAGNELFSRHYSAVYRFFRHKIEGDAADLVQETFLACVGAQQSFRQVSSFRAFLFGIARNQLLSYWRKRAVRGDALDFDSMSIAALSTTRVARQEERARLLAALRDLPLDQQLLLELHYWEELDGEQLAAVFAIETATTRSRLTRARQALRERLCDDPELPILLEDRDLDAWARQLSLRPELDEEIRERSGP